jgi:hypothetical protein
MIALTKQTHLRVLASLVVCSCVVTLLVGLPAAADPGKADILRFRQPSAGAEAFFGDCTNVVNPPSGTVCHESYVLFFRETTVDGGGSNAPSQAPWAIYVQNYTLTFGAPGTDPTITDFVDGFLLNPPIAVSDRQHLSSATVAAQVPLSNGSTFDFQGTWTATSDRFVYGNNGPLNEFEGLPRHYNDKCITSNANAHQTLRNATMSGTLNGHPVRSYASLEDAAAIFYNHFVYIDVSHGGCD